MYESPIQTTFSGINIETLKDEADAYIVRAVQRMGVQVDKEELVKALQYDRDQYLKGFADGRLWQPSNRTNADRIRSMTDEELAEYMGDVQTWGGCPNHGALDCKENCADCWLDWLREEVDE